MAILVDLVTIFQYERLFVESKGIRLKTKYWKKHQVPDEVRNRWNAHSACLRDNIEISVPPQQ